jgi:hypothetical protein
MGSCSACELGISLDGFSGYSYIQIHVYKFLKPFEARLRVPYRLEFTWWYLRPSGLSLIVDKILWYPLTVDLCKCCKSVNIVGNKALILRGKYL